MIEITDSVQSNTAVLDGEIDVAVFQSWARLVIFNQNHENKFAPIATTYYEPMGLYSIKVKNISQIKNGSVIAIPNDIANTARALRLLDSAGLIKLSDHFNEITGTVNDIVKNSKSLKIILINQLMGARVINDVDIVEIGSMVALEGGLNVLRDAIFYGKIMIQLDLILIYWLF